jgi:DNA-binding SARP family transcriptional activator
MRLYYLAGDRASALRQYERCVLVLEEELGVKPSKGTIQLYKQIYTDQLSELESTPPSEPLTITEREKTPMPDVLSYLKTLESSISELQKQLQQSISNNETTIKD